MKQYKTIHSSSQGKKESSMEIVQWKESTTTTQKHKLYKSIESQTELVSVDWPKHMIVEYNCWILNGCKIHIRLIIVLNNSFHIFDFQLFSKLLNKMMLDLTHFNVKFNTRFGSNHINITINMIIKYLNILDV